MALLKLRRFSQVTLPASLRRKLNLSEGDYLEAEVVDQGILLKPVTVIEKEMAWKQVFEAMESVREEKPRRKQGQRPRRFGTKYKFLLRNAKMYWAGSRTILREACYPFDQGEVIEVGCLKLCNFGHFENSSLLFL